MWTDGLDVAADDFIPVATINNYLGAGADIDYLKTEFDKIDDYSQDAAPARALGTIYENDSGKVRFVTVATEETGSTDTLLAYVENDADPSIVVCREDLDDSYKWKSQIAFIVPAGWYYKVSGGDVIIVWAEWELH